ncbi:MurR/RpiR family transcriptional regulator [Marivita sp.]|uniref:MurR/RpiR family transcriptional regulator n=1 Tax=Marivita sp. TaxID=2003365 RepID=UPI0025C72E83|nr:MurR/RpiR family transcriptional regulator [Marivita sp.]
MQERSFHSRVRHIMPDLPTAERKLGELLRNFPGELASYSASELAQLAEVSNATVSRFVRRLGYASYEEARRHARDESASGSRLFLATGGKGVADDPKAYCEADIGNVRATVDGMVGGAKVETLAEALLGARKVWVIGFRAGAPLAQYLQWQLLQVVERSVALPGQGQTLGEHVAGIEAEDVVIIFGLRRRIARFDELVALVGKTGARVALITDQSMALRVDVAWHFRCMTESPGPLFSHTGVMALLNVIANRAIQMAGEAGRKRLIEIEAANDFLQEL